MKTIKLFFWGLWILLLLVCTTMCIHNAQWLGGDETSIVAKYIGWGHYITPLDRDPPEAARFFPLSYSLYNVLVLFHHGERITPTMIYAFHSVFLVFFCFFITILSLQILKDCDDKWKYPIVFLVNVFMIGRIFSEIITCYTGVWIVFTLFPIFLYMMYLFHKQQRWVYGIIALIFINYLIYCYEVIFSIPLSIGVVTLLFMRKHLTRKDKIFNYALIGSALLYLTLYVILIIPRIEIGNEYDPAHGSGVTFISNALHIFYAQKVMWIVTLLLLVRIFQIIRHKTEYCFFDTLLLASCAYCCAAAILRLNYTYYYNVAIIIACPAILYFVKQHLTPRWVMLLFICLALFYGRKIPQNAILTHHKRIVANECMEQMCASIQQGTMVYFFCPEDSTLTQFQWELRESHKVCLSRWLGWELNDEAYHVITKKEFDLSHGIWVVEPIEEPMFHSLENGRAKYLYQAEANKCYLIE